VLNAPNHVGPRPSRGARHGDYLGCTGYGNRLYGIATALLYALVTGPSSHPLPMCTHTCLDALVTGPSSHQPPLLLPPRPAKTRAVRG